MLREMFGQYAATGGAYASKVRAPHPHPHPHLKVSWAGAAVLADRAIGGRLAVPQLGKLWTMLLAQLDLDAKVRCRFRLPLAPAPRCVIAPHELWHVHACARLWSRTPSDPWTPPVRWRRLSYVGAACPDAQRRLQRCGSCHRDAAPRLQA